MTLLRRGGGIIHGSVAEFYFDEGSGESVLDHSGHGHHRNLGSTPGADTNDPAWNAGGWIDIGLDDGVPLGAAITTALGTSDQTVMAVFQWRADTLWPYIFGADVPGSGGISLYGDSTTELLKTSIKHPGGTPTITAQAVGAVPADTWVFAISTFVSGTRLTLWSTYTGALAQNDENLVDIPASIEPPSVEQYIGNDSRYAYNSEALAFAAMINRSYTDAEIQDDIYPRVQALMAAKPTPITLP